MTLLLEMLKFFHDYFTPRFLTEDVAVIDTGERYELACSMRDVLPGERFDGIVQVRSFNFLGMGLFPKQVGLVRQFVVEYR